MTKIIHQDTNSSFLQYGYNSDGTLAWSADENHPGAATDVNQRTRYVYDDYKRVTSKTDPLNHTTGYAYVRWNRGSSSYDHTYGFVFDQTSPLLLHLYHDCDDNYRISSETRAPNYAPETAITNYDYYADGLLNYVVNPNGKMMTYFYDERGRMKGLRDTISTDRNSDDYTVSWTYDAAGNKATERRTDNSLTTYDSYDELNRLKQQTVQRTATVSDVTQMTYWPDGNLKTMVDPRGKTYSYDYDLRGHKWHATYPFDGAVAGTGTQRQEISVYDDAGNLKTFQNRNGNVQTFLYDNRNRATSFSWNDGVTSGATTVYDDASRVTEVDNNAGVVGFTYFGDNTLKSQTQSPTGLTGTSWTQNYTYDADGRRITLLYPSSNNYTYTYSRRNELLNLNDTANPLWVPIVTYTYDSNGNRLTRALRNGTTSTYTVDELDRVTHIQHQFTDQQWDFDYDYDAIGRREYEQRQRFAITSAAPSPSPKPPPTSNLADGYVYNLASELTSFTRDGTVNTATGIVTGGASSASLSYDANGNRVSVSGTGYAVNDLNEYTSVGATALTYEINGSLKTYNGWTYTYDAQNRLTKAVKGGTTVNYAYDGVNRQMYHEVVTTTPAATTRTYNVWDGWNLLEERDGAGNVVHCYIHGAVTDEIVSRFQGGFLTRYYYQDGRGNTTHFAGDQGYLQERVTYGYGGAPSFYDGAGTSLTPPTSDINQIFSGSLFSGRDYMRETGLYDFRNRFYLPGLGGFLQPDPSGFAGDSSNLYRYCGGDPVNKTDPDGLVVRTGPGSNGRAVDAAIYYLTHSATFSAIYSALNTSSNLYSITTSYSLANGGFGPASTGGVISWNPSGWLLLSNGGVESPQMVLAHELAGHGYDYEQGQYDRDINNTRVDPDYDNMEEYNAVQTETKIADELGESTRTDHRGWVLSFLPGFQPVANWTVNGARYYSWAGPTLTGSFIPTRGIAPVKAGGPFDPGSQNFNLSAWLASYGVELLSSLPVGPATSQAYFQQMNSRSCYAY